jgi:hypothetical protein
MRHRGPSHRSHRGAIARAALTLSVVTSVFISSGCGGQTSSAGNGIDIASGPLAGKIGGVAWTIGTAESNAFLSDGSDRFFVDAYTETFTPCTGAGSSLNSNRLVLNIPKTAGDYQLGLGLTETFYVPSTNFNYATTRGRIVVDAVAATMVTGGAHFQADANNFVDGQFQIALCPAAP